MDVEQENGFDDVGGGGVGVCGGGVLAVAIGMALFPFPEKFNCILQRTINALTDVGAEVRRS